jgi:hypothetical protein
MRISVAAAKGQFTDLVGRAEAGDEIVLTGTAMPPCGWSRSSPSSIARSRKALLDPVRASATAIATAGGDAARNQDFLYGEWGLRE